MKSESTFELIKQTPEAKIMMQSSYSDNSEDHYNIETLNHFDPGLHTVKKLWNTVLRFLSFSLVGTNSIEKWI